MTLKKQITYSQLRNSQRQPLEEQLPLDLPFSIYIEPTNKCNFKCLQCPTSFSDYKDIVGFSSFMDMNLYKKILDDIKKMGKLKSLKLYLNGEPLLHKNIVEMIMLASNLDITDRIEMTTNAALLTEDLSKNLINSGLTYLRISIYSIIEEKNQQITNSKIGIDKIFNNIKNFKKLRDEYKNHTPFLYVKMIDTFDKKENEDFINKYKDIADEVAIEAPMNWNGYLKRDYINNLYNEKSNDINREILFANKKEICPFPFYSLVINCNGDVGVCCVDWNIKTKIGNIKEKNLSEIWFGENLRNFRKMHINKYRHKNESCKNCTYLYTSPDNIDNLSYKKFEKILKVKHHEIN